MSVYLSPRRGALPRCVDWKPLYGILGALLLLILQLLSGTGISYALLVCAFTVAALMTIRVLGGIQTLMGLCVAVLAGQHVILSQIMKVVFWQPADAALRRPLETMGIYAVSMTMMLLAAVTSRQLISLRRKPLFASPVEPGPLFRMAVVCIILAAARQLILAVTGLDKNTGENNVGGFLGPLKTLIFLDPLAVACATAYLIVSSQKRKSFGLLNGIAILIPLLFGFVGAGRASMSLPLVTYVVTCIVFRFRFRPIHFAVGACCAYAAQMILFPYALLARSVVRTPNFSTNITLAVNLLTDIVGNPIQYQALQQHDDAEAPTRYLYYGRPLPTLDRYAVLIWTDGIVDATLTTGTIGFTTITPGFEMLLPRFLDPDKPIWSTSNFLAHRADEMVNKEDLETQITLGFTADAFSSFGWLGVVVIPFLLTLCFFTAYRLLMNDHLWGNVFAISLAFIWPWDFSEGTIAMLIVQTFLYPLIICVALWTISLVANFSRSPALSAQRLPGLQAARRR